MSADRVRELRRKGYSLHKIATTLDLPHAEVRACLYPKIRPLSYAEQVAYALERRRVGVTRQAIAAELGVRDDWVSRWIAEEEAA